MMMNTQSGCACFCLVVVISGTIAAAGRGPGTLGEEGFLRAMETARNARTLAQKMAPADIAAAREMLKGIRLKRGDGGYAVVEYVRSEILVRAGLQPEAERALLRLTEFRSTAPEAVLGLVELSRDRAKRVAYEECLAELLPVSVWRRQVDARWNVIFADINPARPNIPAVREKAMLEIGSLFLDAGLYERAWTAHIEAIYAARKPSWIQHPPPPREHSWVSPDAAELWRGAADSAWKAGRQGLAYDYLAKSIVFGVKSESEKAKATLRKWSRAPREKKDQVPDVKRREALERIAKLYAELNVHPRALELIQAHAHVLAKAAESYEHYSREWKAVLASQAREADIKVVYGKKLSEVADPARIKVPFPCSDESLKAVVLKARRLARSASAASQTKKP